jgi:hypothetical protein
MLKRRPTAFGTMLGTTVVIDMVKMSTLISVAGAIFVTFTMGMELFVAATHP